MNAANVVDSSGWLEYFADSAQANQFAPMGAYFAFNYCAMPDGVTMVSPVDH